MKCVAVCFLLTCLLCMHTENRGKVSKEVTAQKEDSKESKALDRPEDKDTSALSLENFNSWYDTIYENFKKYVTPVLKSSYNNNPYRLQQATVTQGEKLNRLEEQFLLERDRKAHGPLRSFFSNNGIQNSKKVRIAFCGTGGGYRAMVLTSGYLAGLEQIGLLDSLTHISTLSGSTWFLAPWIMSRSSVKAYQETLLQRIRDNLFALSPAILSRKDFRWQQFIKEIIWPKFLFDQPLGFVDWYGGLLSYVLFRDKNQQTNKINYLSSQREYIGEGERPLPLYTSVSMHKDAADRAFYNWYEFSPYEVRNLELNLAIPAYSFGSIFDNGKSQEIAPEQSIGFLLGIFGSALAINIQDIIRIMLFRTEEEMVSLSVGGAIRYATLKEITKKIDENLSSFIKQARIQFIVAQVHNPFKGMAKIPEWLEGRELLTMIDGGIAYNIPIRPLLRPERNIDAIIIGESSTPAGTAELIKAIQDAKQTYGYIYQRADSGDNQSIQLFKDFGNPKAPLLIYVNFLKDTPTMKRAAADSSLKAIIEKNKLANYDVVTCLSGKCGTFNFDYNIDDFNQLSGAAEFNIIANQNIIANFIAREFFQKTPDDEEPWEIGR